MEHFEDTTKTVSVTDNEKEKLKIEIKSGIKHLTSCPG